VRVRVRVRVECTTLWCFVYDAQKDENRANQEQIEPN